MISKRLEKFNSRTDELANIKLNAPDGYTPTMTGVTCQLYNPQGQGHFGLCWAASVATIVNYRIGSTLDAQTVADEENVSYNAPGTLENVVNSLHRFTLTKYTSAKYQITWSQIQKNIIDNQRPIYVSAKSSVGGHGVVCFGCKELNSIRYLNIWNPGDNDGKGKASIIRYSASGTSFTFANYTWVWTYTVSRYN